jgi:hypothetical protein
MSVSRCKTTRTFHEKAHHGAEKSCLTKRRLRGLRKNRDRGNAEPMDRQPKSKKDMSRKVNHSGRKFIWAEKAGTSLRKDMERLNKFPRGILPLLSPVRIERMKCKKHCEAKWQRLHSQALLCGFPPLKSLIFHDSFYEHLLYSSSRMPTAGTWDEILSGLPRPRSPVSLVTVSSVINHRVNTRTVIRDSFVPRRRVCRTCGHIGSGQHAWNSCRQLPMTNEMVAVDNRRRYPVRAGRGGPYGRGVFSRPLRRR